MINKLTFTVVAATMAAVLFTTGCSKSENAAKSNAPAEPVSDGVAARELPAVTQEVFAMVESNKAASVEMRIYSITNANVANLEKVQAMLMALPTLEREDQRKLAHALVASVDNAHYNLLRETFADSKLHPQVLSVFMTDVLKRNNQVKMPMLLELARIEGHPSQADAKQMLAALVGKDYGTDWAKWQSAIDTMLENSSG